MRSLFGLARQSESAEVLDLLSKLTEKIDDSIEPMKPQHMCQALYGLASLGGTWQVPTANASAKEGGRRDGQEQVRYVVSVLWN